jgi:uncharacterized membrane protein YfcA
LTVPLITDWHFYALAVPCVIMLGISKSGFGAGFGALCVPLLAMVVTVPEAAALLMPVLLLMDLLSMAAFRKDYDRALLRFLIPCALVGVLIGTALFKWLDPRLVAGIVGVVTLLFLAQRLLFPPRPDASPPPRWVGAILVAISGFTSFIAHAGSPPLSAYVIPLKLKPVVFAATLSFLFFWVNLAKWIPYAWLGLLEWRTMATSMLLLPMAPIGIWMGQRIARRISPALFYRLIHVGIFLTGCKLTWDGLVYLGAWR